MDIEGDLYVPNRNRMKLTYLRFVLLHDLKHTGQPGATYDDGYSFMGSKWVSRENFWESITSPQRLKESFKCFYAGGYMHDGRRHNSDIKFCNVFENDLCYDVQ